MLSYYLKNSKTKIGIGIFNSNDIQVFDLYFKLNSDVICRFCKRWMWVVVLKTTRLRCRKLDTYNKNISNIMFHTV